jgi:hypothetical protein
MRKKKKMANKTTLQKTARNRRKIIRNSEVSLMGRAGTIQNQLLAMLLEELPNIVDVEGGRFVSGADNIAKFDASDFIEKFLREKATPKMLRLFNKSMNNLNTQAKDYYKGFGDTQFSAIRDRIFKQLKQVAGLTPAALKAKTGFFSRLVGGTVIQQTVRAVAINAIAQGQSLADFRQVATQAIGGKDGELGVVQHHYYTEAHDAFAEYDRTVQNTFGKALNLNYAIYQGGKMTTTRTFCIARNGKTYKREEIESWQQLEWQGKKEDHDVLIDAGGYNCRHYFDWISFELAKQLRPNIGHSVYDVRQ